MPSKPAPIDRIVAIFGGQNAFARALGISQGTVSGWVKTKRIPVWRVEQIVEAARRLPAPRELTAADFLDISQGPPAARTDEPPPPVSAKAA